MSNEQLGKGTMLAIGAMCAGLIREDPALIKRLQKVAKKMHVPFSHKRLDAHSLGMIEQALMIRALSDLEDEDEHMVIPLPRTRDAAEHSAGSLAAGSFAVEFIRKDPGLMERFRGWLKERSPESGDLSGTQMENVDATLTAMAHVMDEMVSQHQFEPQPAPAADLGKDQDGIRFL